MPDDLLLVARDYSCDGCFEPMFMGRCEFKFSYIFILQVCEINGYSEVHKYVRRYIHTGMGVNHLYLANKVTRTLQRNSRI